MTSHTYQQRETMAVPAPVYVIWLAVKLVGFLVRLVMRCVGCSASQPTPNAALAMTAAARQMAGRMFAHANEYRAQHGLAPLAHDERLVDSAYFHALRMAQTGEFAHTLADGVELGTRVTRAGLRYAIVRENIAFTNDTWSSPNRIADRIHQGWVNSPGHRENLLATDVTHLGVAVLTWYGHTYAVQNFARPQTSGVGPLWSPRAVLLTNPFGAVR